MSQATGPLGLYFNLLAIGTLSNKFCNALLHTIPPIHLFQVMIHLCRTQMNEMSGVMMFLHDPLLDSINHWLRQSTLIDQ